MQAKDFESLIGGSLDACAAIERGDLQFTGERALFANLALFTKPPSAATRLGVNHETEGK